MTRKLVPVCIIAGLGFTWPGLAKPPMAGALTGTLMLVQDKPGAPFAALDAQLEAAAVTAALIRAYNVVVAMAEQNLAIMSVLAKLLAKDSDTPAQQPGRQATLEREAEIRGAMDTALESYLRLLGEIENSASIDDITARAEIVQQSMGFRGQGSLKAALPTILLHIKLIHAHAAPTRETILRDLSALATR